MNTASPATSHTSPKVPTSAHGSSSSASKESKQHLTALQRFETKKEEANGLFRKKLYIEALQRYEQLLQEIDAELQKNSATTSGTDQDDSASAGIVPGAEVGDLRVFGTIVRLNLAACHIQLSNFEQCIQYCKQVLTVEPSNAKALYRLGKSWYMLGDLTKADLYLRESLTHLSIGGSISGGGGASGSPGGANKSENVNIVTDIRALLQKIDAAKSPGSSTPIKPRIVTSQSPASSGAAASTSEATAASAAAADAAAAPQQPASRGRLQIALLIIALFIVAFVLVYLGIKLIGPVPPQNGANWQKPTKQQLDML